ncbi:hypothetical protein GH714_019858 [Hevea brasiliensis]|uniref:BED-type domain-containing protein n=1 Tax=Hevea brasiliensis TaxID=3981 RepID=A0A6A6L3G5_HEVBR|nr:hypothetical protein GH714_019858 [Hevea brasiliensis]
MKGNNSKKLKRAASLSLDGGTGSTDLRQAPMPALTSSIDKSLSKDSQCAFSTSNKPPMLPSQTPLDVDENVQQPNANETNEGNITQSTAHPKLKSRSGVWVHFEKLINSEDSEIGRARCVWCKKDLNCILNFTVIKSHKGVNIGNAIDFCMEEWGLSKVMCFTVDNASSNDSAISQLKKRLVKKNAFVLGGDAFHMRCCAHIIQLVVRDGLDAMQGSIKRMRDVVKYIRSSPQCSEMFKKCCQLAGLKSKCSLQLDCPIRWNSTYLMLESAVTYQKAFNRLEDIDNRFQVKFGDELPTEFD